MYKRERSYKNMGHRNVPYELRDDWMVEKVVPKSPPCLGAKCIAVHMCTDVCRIRARACERTGSSIIPEFIPETHATA